MLIPNLLCLIQTFLLIPFDVDDKVSVANIVH